MLMPAELKGCVMWSIYFLDLLWERYNCAKFHPCRICLTDFEEDDLFGHPWAVPKTPILNTVNKVSTWNVLYLQYLISLSFIFVKCIFITATMIFIKSDKLSVENKCIFGNNTSMHEGFFWSILQDCKICKF